MVLFSAVVIGQALRGLLPVSPVNSKAARKSLGSQHARHLYKPVERLSLKLVSTLSASSLFSSTDHRVCRLGSVECQDLSAVIMS